MPIVKFGFKMVKPFSGSVEIDKTTTPGNGSVEVVRIDTEDLRGQYRARCRVRVPDSLGNTAADLFAFWISVADGALIFGFKDPLHETFFKQTLEALGTAAAAQTDFPLDLQYVDDWSLRTDLKILALTIPAVLRSACD